ncbi:MAG: conjugal transfer protein TraH [Acinetobacter sp.]|nr:conjugal transfer protein TraH [Acinetobacter sp.]
MKTRNYLTKKQLSLSIALMVLMPISVSNADMQSSLQGWMSQGEYVNVNKPAAYQSQAAGYGVSLGGMRYRTPVEQVFNFGSVRTPKMSGGCGGIDMDLGGFNFINKDQLVQQLRAIASNAKGMIFQMAVDTVSSMIGGNMKNFANKADFMNKYQMDSCHAASLFLNDASTILKDSDVARCREQKISKNGLSFDQADRACTSGGERKATLETEDANRTPEFHAGNIAWQVMMLDPYLKANTELATLLMNMTGTIIKRDAKLGVEVASLDLNEQSKLSDYIPPWFLTDSGLFDCLSAEEGGSTCETESVKTFRQMMVYGKGSTSGSVKMFVCNDGGSNPTRDGCRDLKRDGDHQIVYEDVSLVITKPIAKDFMEKINAVLTKILNKNAAPLTADEIGVINQVKGPLYRYMLASTTMLRQPNIDDPLITSFIGALGEQIVAERMADLIEKVRKGMLSGAFTAGEEGTKQKFMANVEKTETAFLLMGINAQKRMTVMQKMQENTSLYEKALVSNMTAKMASRMRFGG